MKPKIDSYTAVGQAILAAAPFIGVGISYIVFTEPVTARFMIAFAVMLMGAYLAVSEEHEHQH